MKKNNIMIFFSMIFIVVFLIVLNTMAIRDNNIFLNEQMEIKKALEMIEKNEGNTAFKILQKYENNTYYCYGYEFSVNYALLLVNLKKIDKADQFFKYTYNFLPYVIEHEDFIKTYEDFLTLKEGLRHEE